MRSGDLDRRVTLQHRVLTRNARGEEVESFTDYVTVWAKKEDAGGREFFSS